MYIHIALTLFFCAILLILLSHTTWIQSNFKWMTNIYFYLFIGAILGSSLLLAAYILALKMIPVNQS